MIEFFNKVFSNLKFFTFANPKFFPLYIIEWCIEVHHDKEKFSLIGVIKVARVVKNGAGS